MPTQTRFPRFALVLIILLALCGGIISPRFEAARAKPMMVYPAGNIVISEFRFRGDAGATDEFVEIYNPTSAPIEISGWLIRASNGFGAIGTRATIPTTTTLQPGQYYLIANNDYTGPVTADLSYGTGITDDGGVALTHSDGTTIVDQVGLSTSSAYLEGTPLTPLTTNVDRGYERRIGGANGNCQDDANNVADFFLLAASDPQNSFSAFVNCGIPTPTPSFTNTATNTNTPTITNTPTVTNTPPPFTYTPSLTPAPGEVVISEVAWSGTLATINDEWIELHNTRAMPMDINDWRLVSNSGSVDIVLNGVIPGNGYFLLERARDLTVSDVPANQIYTGTLSDSGDILRLSKPDGTVMDTANSDGGAWPAGSGSSNYYSMERIINGSAAADTSTGWVSNNQPSSWTAHDAANNLVHGTPGNPNFNSIATITPTSTMTLTPTRTVTPTSFDVRSVIINEVAWAGTTSGLGDDEWIELYNPGSVPVDITDWVLKSTSDPSPEILLNGVIPAGGYFLLERDDDATVSDISADQIYTGSLSNSGEKIYLYDTSNKIIDSANGNGGSWPRGSSSTYGSMERIADTSDSDSAWVTNGGSPKNGKNANGGDILGTPKNKNTVGPTPTPGRAAPTSTPRPATAVIPPRPIINEILARPGFDWNQDGKADVFDEFIEIKNLTSVDISLSGWKLDTVNGRKSFTLPDVTLKPGERIVYYSRETNLLLSDGGETVRLIRSTGKIYDAFTYNVARAEDQSFCRLPDGNPGDSWFEDCVPTPNLVNTREGSVPTSPDGSASPVCNLPDTIPLDFFIPECNGYGADIWNPFYWDFANWIDKLWIQQANEKWRTFIE